MFEKPKKIEREPDSESIERTGARFLSEELDSLPDTKKAGGFLLTTLLAMGMALAGTGNAEAQVRTGRFSLGGSASGITGEVVQHGRIGANQVIERKKMEASLKISREYQQKFEAIDTMKNRLAQDYKDERISPREYEARKQQLDNEVYRLSREKDIKMANPLGVKGKILEGVLRGY